MADARTAAIIGVGPGLGMSMARRFGQEGFRVALVSRTDTRHASYLADLAGRGIAATAHTADVTDADRLAAVLAEIGEVEFAYYGPAPTLQQLTPIAEVDVPTAQAAFEWVWPAIQVARAVLPGMVARKSGGLILAGGLSSVRPMPMLGQLTLSVAALRNYALTLNAALAEHGVYAGTLTIGGLIERGDIHAMMSADPAHTLPTLDPDLLADAAWDVYRTRDQAEQVFDVINV